MASSFANPYASSRGPQKSVQDSGMDWFRSPAIASNPAPKPPQASAPKTQGTPYQAYAQQGQAQSIPSQSQGTPYQAYSQPSRPTLRPARQTVTGDWQGSYAAAPASQRPPPFQMGTAQTPWGQSMDPFVERDAFINQLNQQRIQNQVAFNSGGMTDPTAGMTPGLNYQLAMQQAGLGGGAPSMAANYGDSLIQRLNQAFGGQGDPFTFANQQGYYQPQGAPAMTQQASQYQPIANLSQGFRPPEFNPAAQGAAPPAPKVTAPEPASQPDWEALYGGSKDTPSRTPNTAVGQAQSIAPPSQGTPYGSPRYSPVGETLVPIMQDGRPAYGRSTEAKSKNATQFIQQLSQTNPATWNDQQWQDYQSAQRDTGWADGGGYYKGQDGQVYYGGGYVRWGEPAPKPIGRNAQRNQYGTWETPSQGTPYQQPPARPPTANGSTRTDPGSGKTVTYQNGHWTWEPNPISGQQLGDIQSQREKAAKQKAAGDAWIKGAPARLEKEREARRNTLLGKQAQASIDKMQAEVANLERNLNKGSLSDKNAKLKRIRELQGKISTTAANYF